jgi:hypothetical protein
MNMGNIMRYFVFLLLIAFATPALCEEMNTKTWTYSSGLKILSIKKLEGHPGKLFWEIEPRGSDYIVTVTDFFFRNGEFEELSLNDLKEGKATLTVKSKEQRFFKTKDEYPLQVTIRIEGKRLHKGQIIYFYNGDYCEVAGHQIVK